MPEIQSLEFKNMLRATGAEVSALILNAVKANLKSDSEASGLAINGFSPQGHMAFERYISPQAIEQRSLMGYVHELAYVSGQLAGVIEVRGADRISMLFIHPDYVNKGLGTRLIARAASRCSMLDKSAKHLTVYATDDTLDFYERVGFVRSGPRKETGGIFATPYKLPLSSKDTLPSAKLHSGAVELFVFTGTGNSLIVAQAAAEVLKNEGVSVHIRSMDRPCPEGLSVATAIGLAFPVACFSTYPTVWRFIDTMPAGEGREVFALGTCGGMPAGMQGVLRKALSKKGYKPVAAKILTMPGNYNNKTLNLEKNAARVSKSVLEAQSFAYDLLNGSARWKGGVPIISSLWHMLGQTRMPWNAFYKIFPITVDEKKCIRCSRCVRICPAGAMSLGENGFPNVARGLCESCQRCMGFCPKGALHVPGKPCEPYKAMNYGDFKGAFE